MKKYLNHLYIANSGINWDVKTFKHIVQLIIPKNETTFGLLFVAQKSQAEFAHQYSSQSSDTISTALQKRKAIITQQTSGWK